jgi:hypothetical protein
MEFDMALEAYLEANRDNLKMSIACGKIDDAIKVIFTAGYQKGWEVGMTDAVQAPQLEY